MRVAIILVAGILLAESSLAQRGRTPATYGTASQSVLTLTPWDAMAGSSGTAYELVWFGLGQALIHTGGNAVFKIPVHLPAGSIATAVEINYCDDGPDDFEAYWFRQPKNAFPEILPILVSSGTPGCVVETGLLTPNPTIDNEANSYNIELVLNGTDGSVRFLSARVRYRLQVSPSPAVATFPGDVPTNHPFFRFIEALAAAGITSGCGTGTYCPDAPVTRGQMAVFLATALGLHFPS